MPSRAATTSSPRLIQAVPNTVPKKRLPKPAPGVVEQVQIAFKPKNRLATLMGALLGGFVPVATYVAAHVEAVSSDRTHVAVAVLMVLGGLCFSAQTVYGWGKMAFQSGGKALGFTLLVELAMSQPGGASAGVGGLGLFGWDQCGGYWVHTEFEVEGIMSTARDWEADNKARYERLCAQAQQILDILRPWHLRTLGHIQNMLLFGYENFNQTEADLENMKLIHGEWTGSLEHPPRAMWNITELGRKVLQISKGKSL